jgi:transcriptional regulator with XRE-family HTH domain
LYDRRVALGLGVADLAQRAGMTADEIECIEEGGTEPTVALLSRSSLRLARRDGDLPAETPPEAAGCLTT